MQFLCLREKVNSDPGNLERKNAGKKQQLGCKSRCFASILQGLRRAEPHCDLELAPQSVSVRLETYGRPILAFEDTWSSN